MGAVPVKDHYFLGQAMLSKGVVDDSMLDKKKGKMERVESAVARRRITLLLTTFPKASSR